VSATDQHSDQITDEVTTRLRRVNQRATSNRMELVGVLRDATRPLTIPEILGERGDLAQSSVYRNLVILEQAGVVHRIVTNHEHARFELAEDLTGDHHHHLVCSRCGNVEDVPAPARLEASLSTAVADIDRSTGFTTQHHRIDLIGVCASCA
jgi:Fe2+ or Zn2+ uptake regulation protein